MKSCKFVSMEYGGHEPQRIWEFPTVACSLKDGLNHSFEDESFLHGSFRQAKLPWENPYMNDHECMSLMFYFVLSMLAIPSFQNTSYNSYTCPILVPCHVGDLHLVAATCHLMGCKLSSLAVIVVLASGSADVPPVWNLERSHQ